MSFGIVDPIEFTKNYMFLHHLKVLKASNIEFVAFVFLLPVEKAGGQSMNISSHMSASTNVIGTVLELHH